MYLFLPKNAAPPYQTVVYFPGSGAIMPDKFNLSPYADFVPRSGRALVAPVFKSTFERRDAFRDDNPAATAFYRDHVIAWSKDLGRSLDYLETRPDIRHDALAYLGLSLGKPGRPGDARRREPLQGRDPGIRRPELLEGAARRRSRSTSSAARQDPDAR